MDNNTIQLFEAQPIRPAWDAEREERYFSVVDVVGVLTDQKDQRAAIKDRVESVLASRSWQVDIVLSHTTPLSLEPREAFLPFIDQSTVDTSTEEWLDGIERRLAYERWYAGHFHTVKETGKLRLMYKNYAKLREGEGRSKTVQVYFLAFVL